MSGLGVWVLLASTAGAIEFSTAAEVWSVTVDGAAGTDGMDVAWGVAIDGNGNVVAGGTLDGEVNQGTSGAVISWDAAGVERYDLRFETGTVGVTDSLDRIFDVTVDNLDQVTAVGRQPGSGVADGVLWAQAISEAGDLVWEREFIDGVSPEQSAFGVSFQPANSDPFVVGWSRGDLPALSGRWVMMRLTQAAGTDVFTPVTYDFGTESFNPDQALDGFMDTFGAFVAVGRIGIDGGTMASVTNDTQWAVEKFGADGILLWEEHRGGPLEDEASAVVRGDDGSVVVAGFTNVGTDNGAGRDDNWMIVCYEPNASAYGDAVVRWEYAFESAPGASERATTLALNAAGDVLAGGTIVDGDVLAWRGVELSIVDGSERSEKVWPAQATDSIPRSIAEEGDALVLAGSWGNAEDADFRVVYLASDSDSDGTIDALDGCVDDPDKVEAGVCGCNFTDADSDADGFADCNEICDGDPAKQDVGECGCGTPDDDEDADGVVGCHDACAQTEPGAEINTLGCSPDQMIAVDTDDGGGAPPAEAPEKGCATAPHSPASLAALAGLAALAVRRRARAASHAAASPPAATATSQSPSRA